MQFIEVSFLHCNLAWAVGMPKERKDRMTAE